MLKSWRYVICAAMLAVTMSGTSARAGDPATGNPELGIQGNPKILVPKTFKHPGLINSLDELQRVKKKIAAGEESWKTAFEQMKNSRFASLKYKPKPHETVSSGFLGAGAAQGGAADLNDDAIAAYTHALMWVFTDNPEHADKAVEILNSWVVLKKHLGGNWYMTTQWSGGMFPLGAEIIRATYPKWKSEDIAKFSNMLSTAFLPALHNRLAYGNRHFGAINAMMAIGIFNNDRAAVAEAMHRWISYVPCWIYMKEDGPEPIKPDYFIKNIPNDVLAKMNDGLFSDIKESWIYQDEKILAFMKENKLGDDRTGLMKYDKDNAWNRAPDDAFVDGLCAETFRDLGHCDLGFYQLIDTAEMAWHQGIDLYSIYAKRLVAFMELHAYLRVGEPVPKVFYRVQELGMPYTYEIAYNHFHNRLRMDLPNTRMLLEKGLRPLLAKPMVVSPGWAYVVPDSGLRASQVNPAAMSLAWETLTHADIDAPGTVTESHK